MTLPAPARDVIVLLTRIAVGVVFFAHGWQKLVTNGVDKTASFFGSVGIPAPTASAWFATLVELVGGAALIIGLAVPIAGLLLLINMIGAFFYVHVDNGLFAGDGGYELVLVLGAAALLFAAIGSGRFGVDHYLARSRANRSVAA